MANLSTKSKLEAGLKANGWVEDTNARTSKYTVFIRADQPWKLYVGRKGALRRGTTVANSASLTDGLLYKTLIRKGSEELA